VPRISGCSGRRRHGSAPPTSSRSLPGERGFVMVVFTLPSYDVVFKVIRDAFTYLRTAGEAPVRTL